MIRASFKIEGIEEAKKMLSPKLYYNTLVVTTGNLLQKAKGSVQAEMKQVFDRPTPWILGSVKTRLIRSPLEGRIWIEEFPTGRSPADVLLPHVVGGSRQMKRSERYLGSYWVPGAGATLNQYGNVKGGQITKALSAVKAFPEVGYMMNVSARSRKKRGKTRPFPRNFIPRPGTPLKRGIWMETAKRKIKPLLIFIQSPIYKIRFRFSDAVERSIQANRNWEFNEAIRKIYSAK